MRKLPFLCITVFAYTGIKWMLWISVNFVYIDSSWHHKPHLLCSQLHHTQEHQQCCSNHTKGICPKQISVSCHTPRCARCTTASSPQTQQHNTAAVKLQFNFLNAIPQCCSAHFSDDLDRWEQSDSCRKHQLQVWKHSFLTQLRLLIFLNALFEKLLLAPGSPKNRSTGLFPRKPELISRETYYNTCKKHKYLDTNFW